MSTRILYVGTYRNRSGYARAAGDNILALQAAGAELAIRPVSYAPMDEPIYPELAELENRRFDSYDMVVQHIPPYGMSYFGEAGANIGSFYFETMPLSAQWTRRACLMDAVLMPCNAHAEAFKAAPGYDPKTRVVTCPIPTNINRYAQSYSGIRKFDKYKQDGRFVFYTIGELNKRKNLSGLLRAFFAEFGAHEPVALVVKATMEKKSSEEITNHVATIVQEVARGCKMPDTPPVHVIPERLSEDEMMALHLACDCFVQPSCGEAWSIPAFDAMGFGKAPIVTATGGYLEYINETNGWLIPGRMEPVFAEGDTHGELFTGKQSWCVPDLLMLRQRMREAYEDRSGYEEKAACGLECASKFSYEVLGPRLLEVLQNAASHSARRLA